MWAQQKPNGKWQYFERYVDPLTGKRKTTSVTLGGHRKSDQQTARTALTLKIQSLMNDIAPKKEWLTFGDLCARYLVYEYANRKAQTARGAEFRLRVMQRLIGPEALVCRLNAPIVEAALKKDNPSKYNERLKYYKALMRWAYRADLVEDISHIDKLSRTKTESARVHNEYKYLERDEVAALVCGVKSEAWSLLTQLLILSGLRIGEAIALLDEDVDFAARTITVSKTYSLVLSRVTDSPKTESSNRSIYMQDELVACCERIADLKRRNVEAFGNPSGIFFPTIDGGYISYAAYEKYLRENTERILGRRLTAHALRHTHVALLSEAGVPLEIISRRLGHAHSRMTKDIYYHVTDRMKERDRSVLKDVSLLDSI